MFDYSQRPPTPEWDKNYSKIFTESSKGRIRGFEPLDVGSIPTSVSNEDCHYSQGGKYICICKSNICKKDIKR